MLIPEKTRKLLRLKEPYILHLDSMGWKWPEGDQFIRNYIEREWTMKKASQIDVNRDFIKRALNSIETVRPEGLPKQRNGSDCGCFCAHYGEKFLNRCCASPLQFHLKPHLEFSLKAPLKFSLKCPLKSLTSFPFNFS